MFIKINLKIGLPSLVKRIKLLKLFNRGINLKIIEYQYIYILPNLCIILCFIHLFNYQYLKLFINLLKRLIELGTYLFLNIYFFNNIKIINELTIGSEVYMRIASIRFL